MSTSSITARRSLHLVDLENLVGDPKATGRVVGDTFVRYLELSEWRSGDHVIVASNPCIIREVGFELDVPASVHATCGEDGADLMLLSLALPELIARRYGRLVVGSGDGIFAPRASDAQQRGVKVRVVTRPESCSLRLLPFEPIWLRPRDEPIAA